MTSLVPSHSTRESLEAACRTYEEAMPGSPAEVYLKSRGLDPTSEEARSFRLGYVDPPAVGHEQYRGRLAIPYLTTGGVTSLRFRAVPTLRDPSVHDVDPGSDGPKYLSLPGEEARIFNPRGLSRPEPYVCVTEGELDCITATVAGLPAIGIPGASMWRPYFGRALRWYQQVFVLADADEKPLWECRSCKVKVRADPCPRCGAPDLKLAKPAGMGFAEQIASQVKNVVIVTMPRDHDVNSFYVAEGPGALRGLLGL